MAKISKIPIGLCGNVDAPVSHLEVSFRSVSFVILLLECLNKMHHIVLEKQVFIVIWQKNVPHTPDIDINNLITIGRDSLQFIKSLHSVSDTNMDINDDRNHV